jgi:hypothetical protein
MKLHLATQLEGVDEPIFGYVPGLGQGGNDVALEIFVQEGLIDEAPDVEIDAAGADEGIHRADVPLEAEVECPSILGLLLAPGFSNHKHERANEK